jgi:PTH1 family peptidyl-tRNA hydrolase
MKLIVGLGNPGRKYEGTRHNVGFAVLDRLAERWLVDPPMVKFESVVRECRVGGEKVLLLAPQTFMNLSGRAVRQAVDFFRVDPGEVLVVTDDLNLPLGRLRVRGDGSSGGQKGLENILQQLGTQAIARVRIGIGQPPGQMDAADYVLQKFAKSESDEVAAVVDRAADAAACWVSDGLLAAMNRFNAALPG